MNNIVALRQCGQYDYDSVYAIISEIYHACRGPVLENKKVLVKPNILRDIDPEKAVTTHPVVVEALIRFLQSNGATVLVGDSPAVHLKGFRGIKSGIMEVCNKTGARWVDFLENPSEVNLADGKIRIASVIKSADLIISVPKLKNHEFVYFSGAVKNTLGLVPGFSKSFTHAMHQDVTGYSSFLLDLNEAVTPGFFLMDGIMSLEGRGPGVAGTPVLTGVLIGSSNPVALDMIACTVAGYDPLKIPTNRIATERGLWIKSKDEIFYDGPDINEVVRKDFKRTPISGNSNIILRFVLRRIRSVRRLQKRPVFIQSRCIGCRECVRICSQNALAVHPDERNKILLTDQKCIRCYCCSEVCPADAVKIRIKIF